MHPALQLLYIVARQQGAFYKLALQAQVALIGDFRAHFGTK